MMTKLEKTIITHAKQSLREMKTFSGKGGADDFVRALHETIALIHLCKVRDNGLSEQAIHELEAVEKDQMQMLRDWKGGRE